MPVYNARTTVESSINSVLKQSYEDWELVVIDDCSQDDSLEVVRNIALRQPRIRLFSNSRNKGVSYSRN